MKMKQLKKFTSIILLGVFVNLRGYSYDFEINGIYYGYNTNNQTVFVTNDYTKEQSYEGTVVIPNTVTYNGRTLDVAGIGESAFSNCKDLYSVSLPNSIITIGKDAFYNCEGIVSLFLPSSIMSIDEGAFTNCTGLRSINLPDKLEEINVTVFSNCTSLEKITIPNGVERIWYSAFEGCISLKTLTIPSSVRSISRYAFKGCSNIETLVFEDGDKDIWIEGFSGNTFFSTFDGVIVKNLYIGRAYYQYNDYSANYPIDFSQTKVLSLGEHIKKITTWSQSIETIYAFSINPDKTTVEFDNSTYINAKLYVPTGTKEKYMAADGWKNFFNIQEMDIDKMWKGQGNTEDDSQNKQKCEKPTISYTNGRLIFESATDGAICQSTITDTDISSFSGNEVQLTATYHISVYATATNYENSDVATATLCWIDYQPKTEGITNRVANLPAKALLIQSKGGTINVQGADDGEAIRVYNVNGTLAGSAISQNGNANVITSLKPDNIAIVKVGEKNVKIMVK
jgi:hypothetical protein